MSGDSNLTAKEAIVMTSETVTHAKPIISLKEKRKFNWLVLAMLTVIIVVGTLSLLQAL